MKTIIYYYSKTGHTKNYAESIHARLENAEVHSYKEMKAKVMQEYDTIIFMAPVHANKIKHVEKFLKFYPKIKNKNLFIVAVGMAPATPDRRETLITVNLLDDYHIRLYEFQGGFDASKLPWYLRLGMKIGFKIASRDPETSAQMKMVGNIFEHPFEFNDIFGIEKIMDTIHRLERVK